MTLSRGLFESVLRELLVERAEHTVQLFEGSGTQWRKARCAPACASGEPCRVTRLGRSKSVPEPSEACNIHSPSTRKATTVLCKQWYKCCGGRQGTPHTSCGRCRDGKG